MKNIDKLISNISFEVAQNKIKFQDVHEEIAGKDTTFFTYSVKSLIVLVVVLVIPIIYLISVVRMGMSDVSSDKIHLYIMINSIRSQLQVKNCPQNGGGTRFKRVAENA